MGTIVHFEITAASVPEQTQFFADAFGWVAEPSPFVDDYSLTGTGDGPGIDGAVMSRRYQAQPVILWLQVGDLEETIAAVGRAGGAQAGDITEIPGQGRVCYVTAPDGTVLGLRQP